MDEALIKVQSSMFALYKDCNQDLLHSCLQAIKRTHSTDTKSTFFIQSHPHSLTFRVHSHSKTWQISIQLAISASQMNLQYARMELDLATAVDAFEMIRSKEPNLQLKFKENQLVLSHQYRCRDGELVEKNITLNYFSMTRHLQDQQREPAGYLLFFEKTDFFMVLASLIDSMKYKVFELTLTKDEEGYELKVSIPESSHELLTNQFIRKGGISTHGRYQASFLSTKLAALLRVVKTGSSLTVSLFQSEIELRTEDERLAVQVSFKEYYG